jgi:hypothetical protein
MAGELADHAQPALPAVRTALTRLEGRIRGVRRRALPVRGREGCGRVLTCAQALALVPERPMDGTPQPVGSDLVESLGSHVRQKAADKLLGWEGHGVPTRGLSVLIATADLPILDRENTVIRQRDPVDRAAQVPQDVLWAVHGRFAVDHPPFRPDRLRQRQIGAFLMHQMATPSARDLREGLDRHQVGRTGGPPLVLVGGDPASWDHAVDVWMVG